MTIQFVLASEAGQLELKRNGAGIVFNLIQSISIMNNVFHAYSEKTV